jgi:hypothetical protein
MLHILLRRQLFCDSQVRANLNLSGAARFYIEIAAHLRDAGFPPIPVIPA